MRILLVALNARYAHTNLAIRYLREALLAEKIADLEVRIREFSINEHIDYIAGEIYEEKPDLIAFSCYIWNMSQIGLLIRQLSLVLPQVYLAVGGPEVSFDPVEVLTAYPQLDAVVIGEGEKSFPCLVKSWVKGARPFLVKGIAWSLETKEEQHGVAVEDLVPEEFTGNIVPGKFGGYIVVNELRTEQLNLNQLPNPYPSFEDFQGKLAYVETSRGCPFQCEYCISSTFHGVRYLEPASFRKLLQQLFKNGARTIKFVDRTFNANRKHAFQVLDIFKEEAMKIMESGGAISDFLPLAHCEIAGELLDEEWLKYLKNFPAGMIQLEIGVQSTHQPTLEAIQRPQHFALWKEKVRFLQELGIPIHLDLIAGLPLEGWEEFRNSFNEVIQAAPENLQLGFLKVLKGSAIWQKSLEYGLVYLPYPPYTILQTKELSHKEIRDLVRFEELLEKYYNSGRFIFSMKHLLQKKADPFSFFHAFAQFWQKNSWFKREWKNKDLFQNLWEFLVETEEPLEQEIWQEVLRFDYYLMARPGMLPDFLQDQWTGKEGDQIREAIRSADYWREVIPAAQELDRRQWARATAVAYFRHKNKDEGSWYLFYYGNKTQYFKYEQENEYRKKQS